MFSTALSSIATIAQELVELPTQTLTDIISPGKQGVMMHGDTTFVVYPGEYKDASREQYDLHQTRIDHWLSSTTRNAAKVLCAALKGKLVRKDTAFKLRKQVALDEAIKRVKATAAKKQEMSDRIKYLEEENETLRQGHSTVSNVQSARILELEKRVAELEVDSYNASLMLSVEKLQHTRQVHYLRVKGQN